MNLNKISLFFKMIFMLILRHSSFRKYSIENILYPAILVNLFSKEYCRVISPPSDGTWWPVWAWQDHCCCPHPPEDLCHLCNWGWSQALVSCVSDPAGPWRIVCTGATTPHIQPWTHSPPCWAPAAPSWGGKPWGMGLRWTGRSTMGWTVRDRCWDGSVSAASYPHLSQIHTPHNCSAPRVAGAPKRPFAPEAWWFHNCWCEQPK